jgi:transposase
MEMIRDRVAGLDVHRDTVVACARLVTAGGGRRSGVTTEKRTFSTMSMGVTALAGWLAERDVSMAVMEATGVYWKPVYYGLEGRVPELWLVNAAHVKRVPGRKTDLSDAEWLADVAAHGMVRPSFVPPPPIRELRELTRYRKTQIDARVREIQRLEKLLQDAGIKLTSVASRTWSKSSLAMVEAMIAGERDPRLLAELSKSRMRAKKDQLVEALDGRFAEHHGVVARRILDHIAFLDTSIASLSAEIAARMSSFEPAIRLLCGIPGWGRPIAETFIAETGGDMTVFPTAGQLAAWSGMAPGSHESAGKRRPAGAPHGNRWLGRVLIEAARAAARTKNTYLSAQYRRLAARRGPNKASVAVAHSMVVSAWHMLTTGEIYRELGADYYRQREDPERVTRRLTRQLEELGYTVTLTAA